MNLAEKIERSKNRDKIDFTKLTSSHRLDPLVKVEPSSRLIVKPIWTYHDDLEGRLYAHYIAGHPEYDGVYLRTTVLGLLIKAAQSLPEPYQLVIRAGHRPAAVQRQLLQEVAHDYQRQHPAASTNEALAHARLYVSDPDLKLPPHCCGAAVDVDIYNPTVKTYLDFGSRMNEASDISHLHSPKAVGLAATNRQLLLKTMLTAGFASYYAEWWHYSYGDQNWAWFYGQPNCLYDIVDR